MDFRAAELESEVAELRCEVEYLRGAVERLTLRVDRVEHRPSATPVAPSRAGSALGSYSVVGETNSAVSVVSSPPRPVGAEQSWGEREEICRNIGHWISVALSGGHRGSSGRDRIRLASRVWIVAQDYYGDRIDPVGVYHTFASARHLVKRGSDLGSAVFVGLPSIREAKIVVSTAGLQWPADH